MFKYSKNSSWLKPKSITADTVPEKWYGMKFAPAPRLPYKDNPKYAGALLVMQYIEGYVYRTWGMRRAKDDMIEALYNAAKDIEPKTNDGDYPPLEALMNAAFNGLHYVQNGDTGTKVNVAYVKNTANYLKYYIRQYGQLIIEAKITSTTHSQHGYTINKVGNDMGYDGYSKGFIAYGYNGDYMFVQNSLGPFVGKLGFHRISWSVVPDLVLRGACWELKNPS